MKIVICGAGLVGSAIASHLSEEHNDVTVIDASQENIQRITDQVDVHGVVGVASHPDRLAEAGVGGIVFAEVAAFVAVLAVGLAYVWGKGGLSWDR